MDHVFQPDQRRWISPLTNLGRSIEDLKRLVHVRKEELLVIDPTVESTMGDSLKSGTAAPGGIRKDAPSQFLAVDYPLQTYDLVAHANDLHQEMADANKHKWSSSDAACEAAVAAVGGPDFFKPKSKDTNCTVIGAPVNIKRRQRRKPKKEKEEEENNQESSEVKDTNDSTSKKNMYEEYNDMPLKEEDEDLKLQLNETIDEAKLKRIKEAIPGGLEDSDDDGEWHNIDNHMDNFVNSASRYEVYRSRTKAIRGLEPNVSDSEDENEGRTYFDENEEEISDDPENGELNVDVKPDLNSIETSGPSTSRAGSIPSTSQTAQPKEETVKEEVDSDHSMEDDKNNNPTENNGNDNPKEEEPEKDAATDFKRFTEWAFNQAKKRDEIYKKCIRPDMMIATNLSEHEIVNLQKLTSANLASVKGEVFQDEALMKSSSMPLLAPPIDRSVTLQSLAIFITHGEEPSRFPWKSVNVQQQMNDDFAHDMFIKRMERQTIDRKFGNLFEDLVNKEEDFLVQLLIYQPTDPDEVLPDEVKMFVEPKLAYELHMLGSQTVDDLMKAIQCESDHIYLQEVDHPDNYVVDPTQFAKMKFTSSMVMIHDTVYHNKGMPNQDYVKIINEWAKKPPKKQIEEFKEGDPKTQLKDLDLRFGYPYVYIHLGGCEHLVVFTKARLLHWEDDHLIRSYPKINGMTRFKNVYCRVDNEYLARWAVLDCKEFPENPMLLCTECVKMYCYDKNKKKRCHFRLLPFTQLANML